MAPEGPITELEERISAAITAADPADFNALALEIYRFQRGANPHYDQYCRALGVTEQVEDWRHIPPLPQSVFKHMALRAYPAEADAASFRTSGTTGEKFGVHYFFSLRLYEEAILRGWDLLRLPALPQIILIPAPEAAPHSSLSHMMGVLKMRAPGGAQHWCIRDGGLDLEGLRALLNGFRKAGQPVLLLGTALSFLHWFEAISGETMALPAGSIAFETGGYKGTGRTLTKNALYGIFQQRLGLEASDIVNEYGMTELSSQCYTRGLARAHTAPPWVRAVVIDPASGLEVDEGGTGVLRIYDLANLGSVMAIQTRDLAIRRGADFELLGRDPAALPRGCSRGADEMLGGATP